MDTLRHVFTLLQVDNRPPARLETGGEWALKFRGSSHVRFAAVVAGSCWLEVEGLTHPLQLSAGDGYLLTRGQSYQVGSRPGMDALDGMPLFRASRDGRVAYGAGRDTVLVSGRFTFSELHSEQLLQILPAVMYLPAGGKAGPALAASIGLLDYETRQPRFGGSVVCHHLAQVMLIEALRIVVDSPDHPPLGWLAALADSRIGVALQAIHDNPARPWTVALLAKEAGMSRSLFALRFRGLAGAAPLDYLLKLRVKIAAQALRTSRRSVSAIAYDVGYQSESAFSNAFKRETGMAPRDFRQQPAA
jgi:AraC-like DNA-binding protein